ncbi:ribose-phosphate pyrophosphokinase [Fusobacterium nucleatum]|uniref:ribose-phosphate pyrophosphokinase n=1 Tax=Fusobacterium nucleatum TaxID=851 RepID=UPI0030D117E8
MSDYTKHLRLIKPSGNEYYDIENFNHNAELIDKETEKLNNAVTKIQEGATREKAGIVQFGTEEGKALEGMMLARLAGCVGYGGDIQTAGVKDINYIYYDRNTRKMYKCLNQNSDVSANVANFIPLDNNSLLDRLENLFKVENHNDISVLKFSNIAIVYGNFKNIRFNESMDITIPVTFKSASVSAVPWHTGTPGNLSIMAYVATNKITIRVNNGNTSLQNISGTFIVVGVF